MRPLSPPSRPAIQLAVAAALLGGAAAAADNSSAVAASKLESLLSGYLTWSLCNGLFVSQRPFSSVWDTEGCIQDCVAHKLFSLNGTGRATLEVQTTEQQVTASLPDTLTRAKDLGNGYGCQLHLQNQSHVTPVPPALDAPAHIAGTPVPTGKLPGVDYNKIQRVVDTFFTDVPLNNSLQTRAVVVMYKGQVVAEQYSREQGVGPDTRLIGWSMTKSVTSALAGVRVGAGALRVQSLASAPSWDAAETAARNITVDDLLRMTSGLAWDEAYGGNGSTGGDVLQMLFAERDAASYVADKPAAHPPGSTFHYSTGSTVLAQWQLRQSFRGNDPQYWSFPTAQLFQRIRATSFVFEVDPSGTFLGGSNAFATAQDWARFGQLFLQDGVWLGERILPEGWVNYSTKPTPANPLYGAGWWLAPGLMNVTGVMPGDAFAALGFLGQVVDVIPSRELVVAHLGFGQGKASDYQQVQATLFPALFEALPGGGFPVVPSAQSTAPSPQSADLGIEASSTLH